MQLTALDKGRVERVIRDLKAFLRVTPVESLEELNAKVFSWQKERNLRLVNVKYFSYPRGKDISQELGKDISHPYGKQISHPLLE